MIDNSSYRIGISVNRNVVGKLPPNGDFKTLNDTFETANVTQREFAIEIWRGHAYTSPHSQDRHEVKRPDGTKYMSAYRYSPNWLCSQHLALDFDTQDERSTFDHLLQNDFIRENAAFLHTTASHTPEKPKARAVFCMAEPVLIPADYQDMSGALTWKFTGHADSACKDVLRLFYGAPKCDVKLLGNWLSIDTMVEICSEFYAAMNEQEQRRTERLKRFQVDGNPTAERIQEALAHIPRKMDYEEWLKVLMAVHSVFPDDIGVSLCESWAGGLPGEVARKFKSFGNGTKVSINSLYFYASKHGWTSDEMAWQKANDLARATAVR